MSSPLLKKIVEGQLCSGCGACVAVASDALQMEYVDPGYLRPRQLREINDAQEERIAQLCPGVGYELDPAGRADDPLWGPVTGSRIGYATDSSLRSHASSGGALTAILLYLFECGMIDGVLQTEASPELPIGNATVLSVSPEQTICAAGSRYAPSAPLAELQDHLAGTSRFAFVGKPCDVAALRVMARFDLKIHERIPILLSFFCAGVPSLTGVRQILTALDVEEKDVTAFRYRGDGWPGPARATLQNGQRREMSYADSWGGTLSKHLQFRCKICPDGAGSFADIVCGDAWECDEGGYPIFEECDGRSLIISRTSKGERIVKAAIDGGLVDAIECQSDIFRPMQPGQLRKKRSILPRLIALRLLGRPVPKYRGFHLLRNAREAGWQLFFRNVVGTLWRTLKASIPGARFPI
ncbi:MAG: Coenzyme F420 hydrogenase/dehydrogenase, beta subunit C-terminal domain [Pseudomonadota bacterium]